MDHHHKKETPLCAYYLVDFTLNRTYTVASAFFAFLGEWMILFVTFSIALFFIPLTPGFTLHSTSSSVLNVNSENNFTANLDVEFLVDDSNNMGSSIHYDSLHVSLFHHQERLSTFSLQEPSKIATQAKFPNVSLMVDEWRMEHDAVLAHGTSCGYVYLDLWFSANAKYMQPMWPSIRDKLQGYCSDVKVELCSSGTTSDTVVNSFLAPCNVYSNVIHKVRLVLFVVLIFLLVAAVAVPLLVKQFFCSSMFS